MCLQYYNIASRDGKIEELRILTANWGGNSAVINEGDVVRLFVAVLITMFAQNWMFS